MNHGTEARRYLASRCSGVLSTLSARYQGHPFGSVTPYVLDHDARPVILVSRLAEHTKNIQADPRVSLLAHDPGKDVRAGARVTLLGEAMRIGNAELMKNRYCRYVPDAENLLALGDFSFFAIAPLALRFIAGFGEIHWIAATDYAPPANVLAEAEGDILAHMNADHAQTLLDYCRHAFGRRPDEALMVGIDCDGFDVRARFEGEGELLRFGFDDPITDAAGARAALVALAKASRAA